MTLEEIGWNFLRSILVCKYCGFLSLKGASHYFRTNTPFGILCSQMGKINTDPILKCMGIDEEKEKELINYITPDCFKIGDKNKGE